MLIVAFVPWALRRSNIHPLVDLRLLKHLDFTVAMLAMMLFAIAFFGASLLFPLYFQEVRGETALKAGLLLAPAGDRRHADDAGRPGSSPTRSAPARSCSPASR